MRLPGFAAFAIVGLVHSLGAAALVSAQQAENPAPAGPRTIVGVVTDEERRPLEDVEIRIGSLNRTARTSRAGAFRFDSVPAGRYELRSRRLGYEAQSRTVRVGDQGATVRFTLKVVPQKIAPVITSVSRGGLGGYVTDGESRPLRGATVRVFGGSERTVTDSAGQFFMDVRPGSFMVRVTSPGHISRLVSVTIPSDSGREIVIALDAGRSSSRREEILMQDLASRMAWKVSPAAFFGRAELDRVPNKRLLAIVQAANPNPLNEPECMAVVNGGPDRMPLWYFDAEDLEAVEVYPLGTLSYLGGRRQGPIARGRDLENPLYFDPARGGAARNCPAVVVWLR